MTIAFAGLTLLALALIVLPRVQRARRAPQRRPAVAMAAVGVAPVSVSWGRGSASGTAVDDLEDEWDDDLGWVEPAPAPPSGGGGGRSCEFCIG